MSIPQELRDLVDITDHGEVDQIDPETGETYRAYLISYVVQRDGLEHSITIASTPLLGNLPDAYQMSLDLGVVAILQRAGLLP